MKPVRSISAVAAAVAAVAVFVFANTTENKKCRLDEESRPAVSQNVQEEKKEDKGGKYAGSTETSRSTEKVSDDAYYTNPVRHSTITAQAGGAQQVINLLEVDLGGARVRPALSFGLIYGFEKLSSIVLRDDAYAAVNGGFFHEYGEPGGMVMVDGQMYMRPTGLYPVLVIEENSARLVDYSCELALTSANTSIKVHDVNDRGNPATAVLYTPVYGSDNRAKHENITVVIKEGRVSEIRKASSKTDIPDDGMILTLYKPFKYTVDDFPIQRGEKVMFSYSPGLGGHVHAYECGAWLVRDGINIAPDRDAWVGVLNNRDPRTAVGIKSDGHTMVLVVADGRQPGYSDGFTASELADFLLEQGVHDAAMLDGGASSEMIVEGEIVNRPSFMGRERKIAGALVVSYK